MENVEIDVLVHFCNKNVEWILVFLNVRGCVVFFGRVSSERDRNKLCWRVVTDC